MYADLTEAGLIRILPLSRRLPALLDLYSSILDRNLFHKPKTNICYLYIKRNIYEEKYIEPSVLGTKHKSHKTTVVSTGINKNGNPLT